MATPVNTLCSFPFNLQRTTHMQCVHGERVGQHVPCHPLFGGSVRVPAARGCQPTDTAGPRRGDTLRRVAGGARHGGTLPAGPLCACAPARLPVCAPAHLPASPPVRLRACLPARLSTCLDYQPACLPASQSVRFPACAPAHLRTCADYQPARLSPCAPVHLPSAPRPCPPRGREHSVKCDAASSDLIQKSGREGPGRTPLRARPRYLVGT